MINNTDFKQLVAIMRPHSESFLEIIMNLRLIKGKRPFRYQHKVQKPASIMVLGVCTYPWHRYLAYP